MANYRDGFEGIISGINNTVAANMNNPNKIKPKSGKGSQGVTPDFVNLAAYTEIITKKNAAQRAQEMMNAQNQKEGTVAEQIISSVSNTGRDNQQGIASQMSNVLAQQKKNMANKNRRGRPITPQGIIPPQGMLQRPMVAQNRPPMPQGIPPQAMPQRPPVMGAAQGGIIGFQTGGAVDQLKALLSAGNVTKDMLQKQLSNLGLIGIGNVNELVAFLQRQGETDLATQVQNAPAQRGPQTSGQLTTDTDLKDTLQNVGAPDDSTKKIRRRGPPDRDRTSPPEKRDVDRRGRPISNILNKAADATADVLGYTSPAFNLTKRGLRAISPKDTATATSTTPTPPGVDTSATFQRTLPRNIGKIQPSPTTDTDTAPAGGIDSIRQQIVDTIDTKVDEGKMDTSTPIADAFAKAPKVDPKTGVNTGGLGLMADAIQDSQTAGEDAQKTVLETFGIEDGKFKEKTASEQQIDELRKYDTSDEAKRAQKQAEDAAFAVNFARTGTPGGAVEGLQRERARDRKAGRDAITERGELRRIDETRMDNFQTQGLDKMFTSIAEANRVRENARNTIATLTETDMRNERSRLDRELAAKAENNRNLQAALKIISDIDYKNEMVKLQKAQNDGTIVNYITQRHNELITAEGELRNTLYESYNIDTLRDKAKGKPANSKEQVALTEALNMVERDIQLYTGKRGDALIQFMGSLVDQNLADSLLDTSDPLDLSDLSNYFQ